MTEAVGLFRLVILGGLIKPPLRALLLLGFLAFALPASCFGALLLDQSNPTGPAFFDSSIGGSAGHRQGSQTFTVGLAGELDSVDAWVRGFSVTTAPLVMEIRSTTGGVPDPLPGDVIATSAVPFSSIGETYSFVKFDFSSSMISVSPGDVLAYALTTGGDLGARYDYRGSVFETYGPGENYDRSTPSDSFSDQIFGDLFFRTFVNDTQTAAVPEPSTLTIWALLGLVGAGFRRRGNRPG